MSQARPTPDRRGAVLITGCSTGIGRATARRLVTHGWLVVATARRLEAVADLARDGCRILALDVCDESSMQAAVEDVDAWAGGVGVLVNNAGYGLEGALEDLPVDEVRRQFDTNVFGPLRLTQLVLPGMRARRSGRIVNVSSVGGRITVPGGGAYHASKHAVEAMSDALRFEVRGFGIDVVVVEPGAVESRWVQTSVAGLEARHVTGSPYTDFEMAVARRLQSAHEGVLALAARPPEAVARVIEQAIVARRPKPRYVVPPLARVFTGSRRFLPDRAWDAVMARALPHPG